MTDRKWKVVVTDREYADLYYEEQVLQHEQIEFVSAQCRTEQDVIDACRDAHGIINQYAPINARVIAQLDQCRVITRYGVGVDTIDVEAATSKGICVANVPDYCKDEVADHALALLLSWTRKITQANRDVKSGLWDYKAVMPIYRLRDRVLGLVGFGMIAQSLAAKVKPLGLQVIAYDPYAAVAAAAEAGVELVSLKTLCQRADFISIHTPLTPSTRGMLGKEQFGYMKKDAVVINTSRGPVVDESALMEALSERRVAGAALDVMEKEPIAPNHPFMMMDNVILTPHVAWYSEEAAAEMRFKAAMGVADVLLHGEYPKYLFNQEVKNKANLKTNLPEQRYMILASKM
ncbi:C-terminal binding protein [Paenibacillus sp. sgz302251]|uniref:C-terminal binding protein n=1 Tax=Paenibacillus sp. sgz302251 TaxID=3414493 RepID=UPI003C7CD82E